MPDLEPAYAAVYDVIRQLPPNSSDDYGKAYENARVWRAVNAALEAVHADNYGHAASRINHEAVDNLIDDARAPLDASMIPALLDVIDRLRKAERFALNMHRQASHYARRRDAEVAEADASVERVKADLADAEARWARHRVDCPMLANATTAANTAPCPCPQINVTVPSGQPTYLPGRPDPRCTIHSTKPASKGATR